MDPTLEDLHRKVMVSLAAAIGNLRMLAIGAPFAEELIRLAEDDVHAALEAAREAEVLRSELGRKIVSSHVGSVGGE